MNNQPETARHRFQRGDQVIPNDVTVPCCKRHGEAKGAQIMGFSPKDPQMVWVIVNGHSTREVYHHKFWKKPEPKTNKFHVTWKDLSGIQLEMTVTSPETSPVTLKESPGGQLKIGETSIYLWQAREISITKKPTETAS